MKSSTIRHLAGALIAGIGLTFLVQNVETIVIPAPAPIVAPGT